MEFNLWYMKTKCHKFNPMCHKFHPMCHKFGYLAVENIPPSVDNIPLQLKTFPFQLINAPRGRGCAINRHGCCIVWCLLDCCRVCRVSSCHQKHPLPYTHMIISRSTLLLRSIRENLKSLIRFELKNVFFSSLFSFLHHQPLLTYSSSGHTAYCLKSDVVVSQSDPYRQTLQWC
jgi:hypothetical protein